MHRTLFNAAAIAVLAGASLFAHCDSLDGPVVNAARDAIKTGDVNVVLPWVQPADEATIKQAFARTLSVRKLNPDAQSLADTWFFETVVRVHRAGEGAPYDGLKPAGRDLGPAIPAADKAIATGNLDALAKMLTAATHDRLHAKFHRLEAAKNYKPADLKAGREYVAAYVDFLHFAERVHQALNATGDHAEAHEH